MSSVSSVSNRPEACARKLGAYVVGNREREISKDLDLTKDKTSDGYGTALTKLTKPGRHRAGSGYSTAVAVPQTIAKQMAASNTTPKPRGNPNWIRGGASPNPRGRPRTGQACAEKIRERVDPDDWIAFELEVANDPEKPIAERRAAWHALIDRGFQKPAQGVDVNMHATSGPLADDIGLLTDAEVDRLMAEQDELLERAKARALALPGGEETDQ